MNVNSDDDKDVKFDIEEEIATWENRIHIFPFIKKTYICI